MLRLDWDLRRSERLYLFIYTSVITHVIVLHLPTENCKLIERRRSYIWLTPGGVIIHTPFYLKIVAHVSPGRTRTARRMQNSYPGCTPNLLLGNGSHFRGRSAPRRVGVCGSSDAWGVIMSAVLGAGATCKAMPEPAMPRLAMPGGSC